MQKKVKSIILQLKIFYQSTLTITKSLLIIYRRKTAIAAHVRRTRVNFIFGLTKQKMKLQM